MTDQDIAEAAVRGVRADRARLARRLRLLRAENDRLRAALARTQHAHATDAQVGAEVRGQLRTDLAAAVHQRDALRAILAPLLEDPRTSDDANAWCIFCDETAFLGHDLVHHVDCPVLVRDRLLGREPPT